MVMLIYTIMTHVNTILLQKTTVDAQTGHLCLIQASSMHRQLKKEEWKSYRGGMS